MHPLVGPYLIGVLLLVGAGTTKLLSPAPTQRALRAVGVPAPTGAVLILGASELALATAALIIGGSIPALLIGTLYLAFAGFVVVQLRAGAASCGCFGDTGAPPSGIHVVLNVGLAVAALVVATGRVPAVDEIEGPLAGLPLMAMSVLGAYLTYAAFTALPAALAAGRTPTVPTFSLAGADARERISR